MMTHVFSIDDLAKNDLARFKKLFRMWIDEVNTLFNIGIQDKIRFNYINSKRLLNIELDFEVSNDSDSYDGDIAIVSNLIHKICEATDKIDYIYESLEKLERANKKYSRNDAFAIDDYLTSTLPKMLRQLAITCESAPLGVAQRIHDYKIKNNIKITHEDFQKFVKEDNYETMLYEWRTILDEIAYHLEEADPITCSMKNPYEFSKDVSYDFNCDDDDSEEHCNIKESGKKEDIILNKFYFFYKIKIERYRREHLHAGMKMIEHFIDYLWD